MADLNITPSSPAPDSGDTGKTPTPPAVTPAPAAGASSGTLEIKATPAPAADDKSTFQNIFNKTEEKEKESQIMSGVLKKKTAADKLKPILGHGPTLQKAIEQEKEMKLKKKLRLVQIVMLVMFFSGGSMAAYFYTELSPTFNLWQNKTAQLTDMNKNIRSQQTQLNKYRYLSAQLDLNQFSYQADQFMDKVGQYFDPNASASVKESLSVGIEESEYQLPALLERVKDGLRESIVI
jgi:hypothetical protein